jgi:hypothetical protein
MVGQIQRNVKNYLEISSSLSIHLIHLFVQNNVHPDSTARWPGRRQLEREGEERARQRPREEGRPVGAAGGADGGGGRHARAQGGRPGKQQTQAKCVPSGRGNLGAYCQAPPRVDREERARQRPREERRSWARDLIFA